MTTMTVDERQARMGLAALQLRQGSLPSPQHAKTPEELLVELCSQEHAIADLARALDLDEMTRATKQAHARFIIPCDDEWPTALNELGAEAPLGLWVRGEDLRVAVRPVALTGARACTTYGEHAAVTLAADLGLGGHAVVTGGSYGVDAAATRGALGVRAQAVIVAASGIDEPYPAAHSRLFDRTAETGTVLTEQPPGSRVSRSSMLDRARLVAALSRATVVVEAAARSGAQETARWTNRLGKPVLAVPGPVTSSLSVLPHKLIRDGEATLVTSAVDIIESLNDQEN